MSQFEIMNGGSLPCSEAVALRGDVSIGTIPGPGIIAAFGPTLDLAVRIHRILSAASLFLVLRTWFLAAFTATATLFASKMLAINAYCLAREVARQVARAVESLWKTQTMRRTRKKLEFEFAMIILGPGTNAMIVIVFWPGWWLVAGLAIAAKCVAG